jgi:thiamine transport system permease protein
MHRLSGLAALSLVPVAALGVFFVLPVVGMLALGFWPEGTFDPGGVLEVLARRPTFSTASTCRSAAACGPPC